MLPVESFLQFIFVLKKDKVIAVGWVTVTDVSALQPLLSVTVTV